MSLLRAFGKLYSVETLDARFASTSKAPDGAQLKQARGNNSTPDERLNGASPPRWKSFEFGIYGVVFAIAIPWMFYTVYDVSQPWNPNYPKFESSLSDGWIWGRKVDNTDAQYSGFRDNLPYLCGIVILHPLLRRAYDYLHDGKASSPKTYLSQTLDEDSLSVKDDSSAGQARLERRMNFDVGFNLLFLLALHGSSLPKILILLLVNYCIATRLSRTYVPAVTWVFNIAILFANELAQGYSYAKIIGHILPSVEDNGKASLSWGSLLDSYGGLLPRWDIHFNITALRLISFNLDLHWAKQRSGSASPLEKKQLKISNLSERDRVTLPLELQDYSLRNYIAHTLYAPLYLAGPILTFNDFVNQQRFPTKSINQRRTLTYGLRFILALLVMEVMIHFIYVVAISKADPSWEVYTPFQLSMLGFFNLHHIWLKLLLPWRFFRLWALLDQIDPPENVVRCMSDNYSALAFWRGWHRSYNRWIIRYIYIPLGGSGGPQTKGRGGIFRAIFNLLVIFSFVAVWHDIQLRLLAWGWLVTLFIVPEVVAGLLFPKSKWQNRKEAYRVICGIGAVGNILMMMAANLVGFAVGLDGLKGMVQGIVGSYSGLTFLAAACLALFTGAQVMFEHREEELRRGINLRC